MSGQPWTIEDRQLLMRLAPTMGFTDVARELGRPPETVRHFAGREGIRFGGRSPRSEPQIRNEWTDQNIEDLIGYWGSGLSAAEIAKTMGGFTRNAIIGKVFRLTQAGRLAVRPKDKSGPKLAKAKRERPAAMVPTAGPPRPRPVPLPEPPRAPILFDVSKFRTVTILTMGNRDCKFDMGGEGADALFCGEPKHGAHFCQHHTTVGILRVKEALKSLPTNTAHARGTKLSGLGLKMWNVG